MASSQHPTSTARALAPATPHPIDPRCVDLTPLPDDEAEQMKHDFFRKLAAEDDRHGE